MLARIQWALQNQFGQIKCLMDPIYEPWKVKSVDLNSFWEQMDSLT